MRRIEDKYASEIWPGDILELDNKDLIVVEILHASSPGFYEVLGDDGVYYEFSEMESIPVVIEQDD